MMAAEFLRRRTITAIDTGRPLWIQQEKPIFPSIPFKFFTGWDWILWIGFPVERHKPVGEQRRITHRDRSRVSRRSRISRIVADRVNPLRYRFQELQTELPRPIGEPSRGQICPITPG